MTHLGREIGLDFAQTDVTDPGRYISVESSNPEEYSRTPYSGGGLARVNVALRREEPDQFAERAAGDQARRAAAYPGELAGLKKRLAFSYASG